jgi:hypothetical protein
MSVFIHTDENENIEKMNIDELFEKKQKRDLKERSIYNKILNRVHTRIKFTSRSKTKGETHIWFQVPEYIFGEPIYKQGDCIGYLVAKLEENGFFVRYIHPGTLFITWSNWIPSYVRNEIRKKTGMIIDEKGNIVKQMEEEEEEEEEGNLFNNGQNNLQKQKREYNDTGEYKPTGALVYKPEMLEKLERKVTFS